MRHVLMLAVAVVLLVVLVLLLVFREDAEAPVEQPAGSVAVLLSRLLIAAPL